MPSFLSQLPSLLPLVVLGLVVLALFGPFFKHAQPVDWSKLKGNHPDLDVVKLPAKFDNSIAGETGAVVSRTPLAKAFAVVFAVAIVVLFSVVIGQSGQDHSAPLWRAASVK